MATTKYLIGLGSNRPHGRHGPPPRVIVAAVAALVGAGVGVARVSRIVRTPPIGSDRDFANAAVLVATRHDPPALLALLKRIEHDFGRRPGRRWSARVIDLDILAWSAGLWRTPPARLIVPHPALAARGFALAPAAEIVPDWRLPRTGRTLRQLEAVRRRPLPVDPVRARA